MKILTLICLLLVSFSATQAQTSSTTARRIVGATTLPATCKPGPPADVFVDSDAAVGSRLYLCTSTNTWTLQGGGGGGTPGGSNTQVQFNDSSAFGGDAGLTYNKTTDLLTTSLLATSTSTTGTIVFSGAGLNDMTKSGTFTGATGNVYTIEIDGTGTPDTFTWNDGAGGNEAGEVAITGAAQLLSNGVSVTFAATTGHTSTNNWVFTTTATPGVVVKDVAGAQKTFLNGNGNLFLGHVGIGANAFIDQDVVVLLRETSTSFGGPPFVLAALTSIPTSNGAMPTDLNVQLYTDGASNFYQSTAAYIQNSHGGSGTMGLMEGLRIDSHSYSNGGLVAENNVLTLTGGSLGTGSVTLQRALLIKASQLESSGVVFTPIGLEIEAQNTAGSTSSYNLWSKGAASKNVFEGDLRLDKLTASKAVLTDASKNLVSTGIIDSAQGGTGNGFTKFTGPASSEKTFTLPNANATLARTDAAQTFTGDQTFGGDIAALSGNVRAARFRDEYGSGSFQLDGDIDQVQLGNLVPILWGTSNAYNATKDVGLIRSAAGVLEVNNATTGGLGSLLAGRVISNKTGNYTVLAADKRTFFTNAGATGTVVFTLPTAVAGLEYTFYVDAAFTLQITAGASTTIRSGASVTAAAGNITNATVGSVITLVAISSTKWVAIAAPNGSWTFT